MRSKVTTYTEYSGVNGEKQKKDLTRFLLMNLGVKGHSF